MPRERTVVLSLDDIELLVEALDSHEYWQLGNELPRSNGVVLIPGDRVPDTIWDDRQVTADERAAIDAIRRCRDLIARLERG